MRKVRDERDLRLALAVRIVDLGRQDRRRHPERLRGRHLERVHERADASSPPCPRPAAAAATRQARGPTGARGSPARLESPSARPRTGRAPAGRRRPRAPLRPACRAASPPCPAAARPRSRAWSRSHPSRSARRRGSRRAAAGRSCRRASASPRTPGSPASSCASFFFPFSGFDAGRPRLPARRSSACGRGRSRLRASSGASPRPLARRGPAATARNRAGSRRRTRRRRGAARPRSGCPRRRSLRSPARGHRPAMSARARSRPWSVVTPRGSTKWIATFARRAASIASAYPGIRGSSTKPSEITTSDLRPRSRTSDSSACCRPPSVIPVRRRAAASASSCCTGALGSPTTANWPGPPEVALLVPARDAPPAPSCPYSSARTIAQSPKPWPVPVALHLRDDLRQLPVLPGVAGRPPQLLRPARRASPSRHRARPSPGIGAGTARTVSATGGVDVDVVDEHQHAAALGRCSHAGRSPGAAARSRGSVARRARRPVRSS